MAHLGVLLELERAGIRPAAVSGTSIGALLAAVWLTSDDVQQAIDRVESFTGSVDYHRARVEFLKNLDTREPGWRTAFSRGLRRGVVMAWTMFRESFVGQEIYEQNTEFLVPDVRIEQLPLPFSVVATDLTSHRAVVFRRGSVRRAVMASGAVPGLFPPSETEDALLVDGAVIERVPVRALAADRVDVILAVDLRGEQSPSDEPASGVEIDRRSRVVTELHLRQTRLAAADLVVLPQVADIDPLDFSGSGHGIGRGREAMHQNLPELKRILKRAWLRRGMGPAATRRLRKLEARRLFGDPLWELEA
jgi:NTE family protein